MSWFQQNAPPQQPQGSLTALGGGNAFDTYKPFPMQPFDPYGAHAGSDLEMRQPGWNQGTPINGPQPVPGMPPKQFTPIASAPPHPNQGHVTPIAGPGWDYNYDPTTGRGTQTNSRGQTTDYNYPASQLPNQGSLQSLGGGQLNQSGMVNLRGPDGSMKAVPQNDLAHWLSKGAVRA